MQVAKETILLVDNNPVYLSLVYEFLTTTGYEVIMVDNPIEAHHILNSQPVDLALIDIRLFNDLDTKDRTGLNLARDVALHVPKIIITSIDTAEMARMALKPNLNGHTIAVDFIVKKEGLGALLTAVRRALLNKPTKPTANGIPAHLYQKLQLTLQSCECCHSDKEVQDIFAHDWLSPWQNNLPQRQQTDSRVRALTDYLWRQRNQNNKNGLVLFLLVLHQNFDAGDLRHTLLKELADELQGAC